MAGESTAVSWKIGSNARNYNYDQISGKDNTWTTVITRGCLLKQEKKASNYKWEWCCILVSGEKDTEISDENCRLKTFLMIFF